MTEARSEHWTPVGPHDPAGSAGLATFKHGSHQLVIARTEEGEVLALDNRCPHEGYPLAQGELKGCTLTCTWHNWKFDARDGACLLGGEAVRSYPTRVRDGVLEVDLSPPDAAAEIAKLRVSLHEGLFRNDMGRVARDAVRLVQVGMTPWQLLGETAAYDARHAEFGSTHTLPLAADCGRFLDWHPGTEATYAIAPVLRQCAEVNQRLPVRPLAERAPGATRESLREAVETEDVTRAEALFRGALEAGVDRATLDSWLFTVLADHFTSFGHPLIYQIKLQEMAPHLQAEHLGDLYIGHLQQVMLATREDTLPYLATYFARLREYEPELVAVHQRARDDVGFDPAAVRGAVLDGSAAEACDQVWVALTGGVPGVEVAKALVLAAAERLLRFDARIETDHLVAENWLWATHRLTFAAAVRHAMQRCDRPESLRFLFQAVAFVHSGRGLDGAPQIGEPTAAAPTADDPVDESAVCDAVLARDPTRAVAATRAFLAAGGSRETLGRTLQRLSLEDLWVRPIFQAHAIKTTVAALEEAAALDGRADADTLILAAVRFLASPLQEGRLRATVLTSIRWVADGEMPRKLTQ